MKKKWFLTVLLLFLYLCIPNSGIAQNENQKKVSMEFKEESLPTVLKRLEKESGYKILFTYDDISKIKVTGSIKNSTIEQALKIIIAENPLEYHIDGRFINVTLKGSLNKSKSQKKLSYTGKVIDDLDVPLMGVSIGVKNLSGIGATTNQDGRFQIELPEGNHTLLFNYIGMKRQEVHASYGKEMVIRMTPDTHVLEETIITGIYTRKAESFTGSAATYKADDLKLIGNQNILQSLSTLDPSFVITDNNSMGANPNATMDISINGKTSITGLSDTYGSHPDQPLFILDGFETTLSRISDLSMDRVESITILKDAASTAIYGSKAANGVIVVERKRPEPGKLRFSYSGGYQVAWADLNDYNLMNASEKLQFEKLSGYYGELDETGEIMQESARNTYYSRWKNIKGGLNSYWLHEPIHTAFTHDHNISAEGGDSAFRYGLAFRYKKTDGVMDNSSRDNIDGSVNLTYRIDRFSFSNQTNVYYTDISNNTVSFRKFAEANPYHPKRDENGDLYKVWDEYIVNYTTREYVYNPLWDYHQKSFSKSDELTLNNNFNIEYRPIDKIRIMGKVGFTTGRTKEEDFTSPFATIYTDTDGLKRGIYQKGDESFTSYDVSLLASYGDTFGKHTYNFVGGAQISENRQTFSKYSAQGYITDQFSNPNFSAGYPEGTKPTSEIIKSRSASYYLNANYAYDLRYLVDFNVRSDGASVFGVNNPFSTTWSFGLAWNIHNENFFKQSEIVNTLKLRYSLGNPGNQNINAKIANNVYTYYTNHQNMFGLAAIVTKWGNKNLKWQRTLTHNIGTNIGLFNSRLHITADYSIRKTDPILLEIQQPTSTGSSSVPMNIGATENKSISLTMSYDIIRKRDWFWKININLLNAKTIYYNIGDALDRLNEEGRASQSLLRYYDGASNSAIWAVRSLGIDPMSGNELFMKKDGSYTYEWDASDEVICGNSAPDLEGNIGSTLRYKGFSFAINFRYRLGGQTVLNTLLNKVENISKISLKYNQDKRALYDRWQKPGDNAKFKRIDDTSTTNISSRFIQDESTFECKSISLGYETSSAEWLNNLGLSSINFRIYMNDIFRFSTVKEERGLDYPFQRAVSASIGLRF